jgi:hypothetical protein
MDMSNSTWSQSYFHELFEYRDGSLFWKKPRKGTKKDKKAGTLNVHGYLQTQIDKKIIVNHRIIFMMFCGFLPKQIDHIDRNTLNNKIENLRPATNAENQCNSKVKVTSKSGIKNVSWVKRKNRWHVRLKVNGKEKHIGYFTDVETAKIKAIEARKMYYGDFA